MHTARRFRVLHVDLDDYLGIVYVELPRNRSYLPIDDRE